jgi:hypothetical protein
MYSNGHFGCIYSPIFFLENNQTTTKETPQITQIKRRNNNELKISKLIKSIPNNSLYFHTFVSCEPIQLGIMNEEYLQKVETNTPFVLLKYNNIHFNSFESFTTNKSNKHLSDLYIYLLKSVKLLLKNKIVHLNANKETIIVSDETPLLTDFSCAQLMHNTQLMDNHDLFSSSTKSNASTIFEIFTIHYLLENELSSISISNIYDLEKLYKKQNLLVDMKEGSVFLKRFINKPIKQIIEEISTYYYTWDNYIINSIFLSLIEEKYSLHCNTQNKFVLEWITLLKTNTTPSPIKRYTVESTIEKMEELVFNSEIRDLLE